MVWNRQGASDDLGECLNDIIVSAHENPSSCLTRTIYWECVEVYMSSVPYNHPYINVILSSWKLAYVKYWRWTVGLHLVWVFSVLHKYPWWWVKHQGRVSFDHKAWGVWAEPKWWFHGIISTNSSKSASQILKVKWRLMKFFLNLFGCFGLSNLWLCGKKHWTWTNACWGARKWGCFTSTSETCKLHASRYNSNLACAELTFSMEINGNQ